MTLMRWSVAAYIAELDELLLAFDPRASGPVRLNLGDAIEVQGPPATSKSFFLYFIAMTTLLPFSTTLPLSIPGSVGPAKDVELDLGGRGKSAAFFDTDARLSIEKLELMMTHHIKKRIAAHCSAIPSLYGATASDEAIRDQVWSALTRLHVFKPTSTISLAASIRSLPSYLQRHAPREILTLLMIDSISAFYYQDRFASEQNTDRRVAHPMKHVMNALADVREELACTLFVTNWALFSAAADRRGPASPFFRQHLAFPFPNPFSDGSAVVIPFDEAHPLKRPSNLPLHLTHQITLHPGTREHQPFSAGTSLHQVLSNLEQRGSDPAPRTVEAHLRLPGASGSAGSSYGVGTFEYRITASGLEA